MLHERPAVATMLSSIRGRKRILCLLFSRRPSPPLRWSSEPAIAVPVRGGFKSIHRRYGTRSAVPIDSMPQPCYRVSRLPAPVPNYLGVGAPNGWSALSLPSPPHKRASIGVRRDTRCHTPGPHPDVIRGDPFPRIALNLRAINAGPPACQHPNPTYARTHPRFKQAPALTTP